MKKTLLSVAFLGASAAYVAAANHTFDAFTLAKGKPEEALIAPAVATTPPVPPSSAPRSVASAAPIEPVVSAAPPVPVKPAPAPIVPAATPAAPRTTVAAATPPQPVMPPLPRPRPADAPSIQTAQATEVAASGSQYRDGSFAGTDENAYYGRVQVQVTIAGGQITGVKALDYPSDRRTSRYINGQALPMLEQEVIQAQSASIDGVSGATLTSEAYVRSLGRALAKAGGSNA